MDGKGRCTSKKEKADLIIVDFRRMDVNCSVVLERTTNKNISRFFNVWSVTIYVLCSHAVLSLLGLGDYRLAKVNAFSLCHGFGYTK